MQRALTLDAALRRPDATDALFGKERIENPATYQAPKTMTPEEAAAKTAELRKAAAEAKAAEPAPAPKADTEAKPTVKEEPQAVRDARERVAKGEKRDKQAIQRRQGAIKRLLGSKPLKNTSNEDLAEGVFRAQRDLAEGFAETPEITKLREAGEAELKARDLELEAPELGQTWQTGVISVEPFGAFRQSDAAEKLPAGSRFAVEFIDDVVAPGLVNTKTGKRIQKAKVVIKTVDVKLIKHGADAKTSPSPIGVGIARQSQEPIVIVKNKEEAIANYRKAEAEAAKANKTANREAARKIVEDYEKSRPSSEKIADVSPQAKIDIDNLAKLKDFGLRLNEIAFNPKVKTDAGDFGFASLDTLLVAANEAGLTGLDFKNFFASQIRAGSKAGKRSF